MSEKLVMKKGQWLTHENGDRYAKALVDIRYHSQMQSDQFELANGDLPQKHTAIPTDVIRVDHFGRVWQVCIDGEWLTLDEKFREGE